MDDYCHCKVPNVTKFRQMPSQKVRELADHVGISCGRRAASLSLMRIVDPFDHLTIKNLSTSEFCRERTLPRDFEQAI